MKKDSSARLTIVVLLLGGAWLLLMARAFFLQVVPNENLSRWRARQFDSVVTLEPRRGDILDRKGKELAATLTAHSLFADPKLLSNPKKIANKLAPLVGASPREVYGKLRDRQKRFVWIERRLDKSVREKIESWKEPGLGFVEEGQRVYPHERLLAQTLGYVGREGGGLAGLEHRFETELKGEERKIQFQRDAFGRPLLVNGQSISERPGGRSAVLTIDSDLQFFLEGELQRVTEEHLADRAMGIVLDAQTSEILAIAGFPSFDPVRASEFHEEFKKNPVVADVFEPGSTLKSFTIAAALREGVVQPNTKIYCEKGRMKVGDRWLRESDPKHKWEWLTVNQILEVSSNIGVAKIAFMLGQEKLRAALVDFGFGEKPGSEIPGETKGILPGLPWRKHHFSNISFGHGVAVSPLQMASAYAAIANGGILRRPTILKAWQNDSTGEQAIPQRGSERRIFSENVASTLRYMLTGVTSGIGTGVNARIPGFIVAGKTGTAQKVDPNGRGYISGSYISSFAGFAPANQPRFVIYVAVDGSRKGYYASEIAAPVFHRVAEYALRQWGVTPSVISAQDVMKPQSTKSTKHLVDALEREPISTVPDWSGLTLRELMERWEGQNLKVELHGRGVVLRTLPAAGEPLTEDRSLKVFLSRE